MNRTKKVRRTLTDSFARISRKPICILLIANFLVLSAPAAPQTVIGAASSSYQDIRFAYLSGGLAPKLPFWFAALTKSSRNSNPTPIVSRVQIYPGSVTIAMDQETVFSAIAYDSNDEPVSGVAFEWTARDVGRGRPARPLPNSVFGPHEPGTYAVKASVSGREAEVSVTVTRTRTTPPDAQRTRISSRTGVIAVETTEPNAASIKKDKAPDGGPETPEGAWDNSNWLSADDPGNLPGNPPGSPADDGAGNGNFQISAPVITLPGRGIDLALNLNYNSRLWNKSGSTLTYNIDGGFPAPGWSLGFGKIAFMGSQGGCMLIDADGTRHGYSGSLSNWSTGMSFKGYTTDGKFIDYGCTYNYPGTSWSPSSGWAVLPNGTRITYSAAIPSNYLLPTMITDAQGNYITMTYRNVSGIQLETITDTMGRVVTFHYDSLNRLIYIQGPRMQGQDPIYGTGTTRILLRLHYRQLPLNASFAAGISTVVDTHTPWVIDSIYYPATNTGYWFGGADSQHPDYAGYYSSFGMLAKVEEHRGMSWTSGSEAQGTIGSGTMTKRAEYNYPLQAANDPGRTPGLLLPDAPTYDTLTESWAGADVAEPAITKYKIFQNTSPRVTNVIQPNGSVSKQYSYNAPGQFNDGLVYSDETYVPDAAGTFTFPDLGLSGNFKRVGKSNVTWGIGTGSYIGYSSPRPTYAEVFDENDQKVYTEYSYSGGSFNQIMHSCDYDNAGNRLKCARANYENSAAYIGSFDSNGQFISGRHIFNLVTSTGIENPDLTRASWTEYEYDNYTNNPLVNTPGVIHHLASHNPHDTATYFCNCRFECEGGISNLEDECPGGGPPTEWVCDTCPNYNASTAKRGNVTKVTSYADAQNLTGPIVETRGYDMTGNLVKSSSACCEETSILYDDPATTTVRENYYAYPVSQTRGSADTGSPHRITTTAVYDFDSGLIKTATDANGLTSTNWYNPDTLRPVKSVSSTGAYTTIAYNDTAMTITEEVFEANNNPAGKTVKHLNGLGQERKVESHGPGGVINIVEMKYTKFGEGWKQSRPFRNGDTVYWTERFYDTQRRLIKIVEPNGSETKAFYNEGTLPDSVVAQPGNRIRVMDPWGRERWGRYDQQGRLIQVIEPNPDVVANPTGSIFTAGSLLTRYTYDTIGRLKETEQGAQFRKFKYDDLGRLTRQKLAEQTATLNDAGAFVGIGGSGATWAEAFIYDNRSNLTQKTDARGVRTNISYQLSGGGGTDPLNRVQSRVYDLTGPLQSGITIHTAPEVTYEYEPSGDKTRIKKIRTDGYLTEDYLYDSQARVSEYKQTVDYRATRPMTVNYLYDTLDRVKEVTYPAQYGLPTQGGIPADPRKIVAHTYDTASRLSSFSYGTALGMSQQAGNIVYNAADQTTEMKIGAAGGNQVTEEYTFDPQTGLLTNQKVQQGVNNLLNLGYEYNRGDSIGTLNGKTGHLTKIIDHNNTNRNREYDYDVLGRLFNAWGGLNKGLSVQYYRYDRYGNRTNVVASGVAADGSAMPRDGIPNLTYDAASNRINTTVGAHSFEYDAAGNQTKALAEDGLTWVKYEYDAANRLTTVRRDSDGAYLQSFHYGSTNARLFDYDNTINRLKIVAAVGGTTMAEYTEFAHTVPTWTKSYTYLGDTQLTSITPNGTGGESVEFNHPDRLGTRTTTNQQAGTSYTQAHLPFGRPLDAESSGTTNKRFTSYERSDITKLDYAVNRTYDGKLGRFTQVDPIGINAASLDAPQTLNMYTYCDNDPINFTDPSGLFLGRFFRWLGRVIMDLFRSEVARRVAVRFVVSFVVSGGNLGVAIRASFNELLRQYNLAGLSPPVFGTPGTFPSFLPGDCPPDCQGVIPPLPEEMVTVTAAAHPVLRALGAIAQWFSRVLPKIGRFFKSIGSWIWGTGQWIWSGVKGGAKFTWKLVNFTGQKVKRWVLGDPKIVFKTEHGARPSHFPSGVDVSAVENAITKNINVLVRNTSSTGNFWGRVTVKGTTIEYRAFTLPNGTINVGTYYPIP